MIKRVVVAGCRDFNDYKTAREYIDFCISKIKKENELIFVSGGCRGADALGERYALENGYKIERYPADWEKYGKSAGPIRNKEMAQKKRLCYLFLGWQEQRYKSNDRICKAI